MIASPSRSQNWFFCKLLLFVSVYSFPGLLTYLQHSLLWEPVVVEGSPIYGWRVIAQNQPNGREMSQKNILLLKKWANEYIHATQDNIQFPHTKNQEKKFVIFIQPTITIIRVNLPVMTIFQASFTNSLWAGPHPAQSVTGGTGQVGPPERVWKCKGIFKPFDLPWPLSEVLPWPSKLRQTAMEWLLSQFQLVSALCVLTPFVLPDGQGLEALSLQSGIFYVMLRKREKGKGVTPISALALASGSGVSFRSKEMKALHSTAPCLHNGERAPIFSHLGECQPEVSSYPTHAKDISHGMKIHLSGNIIKYLTASYQWIEQTLYPPTWN